MSWLKPLKNFLYDAMMKCTLNSLKKLHIHSYSYDTLRSTLSLQLFMSSGLGKEDVSHSIYDSKGYDWIYDSMSTDIVYLL